MKKILFLFLLAFPLLQALAQPFAIGHIQLTYNDPARSNRAIQTELYYPATTAGESVPVAAGTYPVITFGHGFVMAWSAYQNIWEAFVPQGYIIAFPRTEGSVSPVHADFGADLVFLIGKLQSEGSSNSSSLFYGHVGSRSAIMGHSMGGGSSFLAAAGNTNITTMVTFAAANTSPSSITAAQSVTVPALVISGQNDCVAPPAQHQVPMYDSLASACKAFVSINGGGHCYFAETNFNCSFGEGTCTPNPTITRMEQEDAAQDFAGMWLAYYLKDDCAAGQAFSDSLAQSARITGTQSCNIANPVITQIGNQLQSTPAATYQWLLNGQPIAGATAQTYTPTQNGVYSVEVTYYTTCPYGSNTVNWSMTTGIFAVERPSEFELFPNPAADFVQLQFTPEASGTYEVLVYDLPGKILLRSKTEVHAGSPAQLRIDTGALPGGIYFAELRNGSLRCMKKFQVVK